MKQFREDMSPLAGIFHPAAEMQQLTACLVQRKVQIKTGEANRLRRYVLVGVLLCCGPARCSRSEGLVHLHCKTEPTSSGECCMSQHRKPLHGERFTMRSLIYRFVRARV